MFQTDLHSLASDNRKNCNTNDYDENKAKFKVSTISAGNVNAIRKGSINRLIIGQPTIGQLVQQVTGMTRALVGLGYHCKTLTFKSDRRFTY